MIIRHHYCVFTTHCFQPTILCFSCQFGNGKVRLRSEGFVDLVLGTVCLVNFVLEKRQHTCLKRLRILSVQPMDCCNWETKTAKLMCELWASKQALNYVKQWLKGQQILKGWVWNAISLIFTLGLQECYSYWLREVQVHCLYFVKGKFIFKNSLKSTPVCCASHVQYILAFGSNRYFYTSKWLFKASVRVKIVYIWINLKQNKVYR